MGHTWMLFDAPAAARPAGSVDWIRRRVLFLRRVAIAAWHWRPWPTARFYWSVSNVAHYWGCLHAPSVPASSPQATVAGVGAPAASATGSQQP